MSLILTKTFSEKVCIGTAQFGTKYGISNKKEITSKKESLKIIKNANKNGINFFDTAKSYGNSEKILGSSNTKNLKVITKILINSKTNNLKHDIENLVNDSLKKLKVKSIYGLLIHNPLCLVNKRGKLIYKILLNLKKIRKIKKIGISSYSLSETNKIINDYKIDIISFPLNPFDNRLIKSGLIKRIKKKKIELHTRSIFLQGLLLMKKNKRPKRFNKWKKAFKKFDNTILKFKISPMSLCLAYAFKNFAIDKVTIGVENNRQLNEIIKNLKNLNNLNLDISIHKIKYHPDLANPNFW